MVIGIIILAIGLLFLYSIFCWSPGQASRREEELEAEEKDRVKHSGVKKDGK